MSVPLSRMHSIDAPDCWRALAVVRPGITPADPV
jgi:hypothetical protein